jgi:hypothetical protein
MITSGAFEHRHAVLAGIREPAFGKLGGNADRGLMKTGGWPNNQETHGCIKPTFPDGHTYVTTPGSAWLFASLCAPTGDLPPAVAGPARCGDRAAMMPSRTQNRATETPPPDPDESAAVLATMFWNPLGRLRIRRGRQAPAAAVPGAGRQGVGWRG